MRVELYAGNLHHGGAVTVAATFFDQLPLLWGTEATEWIDELSVVASPRVMCDMTNVSTLQSLEGIDFLMTSDHPKPWTPRNRHYSADVRFTVFGPSHQARNSPVEVLGFADGSLLYPYLNGNSTTRSSWWHVSRGVEWFKRQRKLELLKHSDAYVVQTEKMASVLKEMVPNRPVHIVENVVPAVFYDRSKWKPCTLPERIPSEVRLFYPARGYPHKNHRFIASVCTAFEEKYGARLRVVVTLRTDEARAAGLSENDNVINVGEVSASQCPALYEATDGLFFPSLNETASSSPLEALFMGKPVIAADLPFMRAIASRDVYLYDSGSDSCAARVIHSVTSELGRSSASNFRRAALTQRTMRPENQALKYLSILRQSSTIQSTRK